MTSSWSDRRTGIAVLVVFAAALAGGIALLAAEPSLAQTNPFGANPFVGPRPPAAPPESGLIGWLLAKQGEYFQQFSRLIRAAKADGSAVWTLTGVSFAYGIFHAAGPGHGKAVISSYLVANEETWRRGVVLSFASALLQALVAVAVVGVAAAVLQLTARDMNNAVRVIEIAGYALIAMMGARLTVVKGRGLVRALRQRAAAGAPDRHHHHAHHHHDDAAPAPRTHDQAQGHAHHHEHHRHDHAVPALALAAADHGHHDHHHDHHRGHDHDAHVGHDHGADEHCDHCHGPLPQDLIGPGGWRRGLTAIIAVGLRPCSGAILVLVFALAQGLFWAGVVSTFVMGLGTAITVAAIATLTVAAKGIAARFATRRSGGGAVLLRLMETGAAVLVLVFGIALLLGFMASERMVGL